jgi:uncharacterized membrane protein YfhO
MLGPMTVPVENCTGGEPVSLTRPYAGAVVLQATAKCRGLLVLSDTYYPGWESTVDGKPAAIYEAYGAFRAVALEPGPHTVVMQFRPRSVQIGALLCGFGLLLCAVLTAL